MFDSSPTGDGQRLVKGIVAFIGAINCVVVPSQFSNQRPLFPFPGLYLIEIVLLGILVLAIVVLQPEWNGREKQIPWIAAGILLAFVILGAWTIGFFLIPALIAFLLVGILADWGAGEAVRKHVGLFFLAAVVQAGLIGVFALFT
jgi:hypothetical protein